MSRQRPVTVTRVEVAFTKDLREKFVDQAKAHGFSPAQHSYFAELILEASLATPREYWLENQPPTGSERIGLPIKLPVGLVHEYDVLAKRLQRSKGHLISLALARWLGSSKATSPVDERVLHAVSENRERVLLRLREIVVHRLQKLARERQLSIHWLIEDLLIKALAEISQRPRPEQRADAASRDIKHERESFGAVIQRSTIEAFDEQKVRLRYVTRADLIEEVLIAAVDAQEERGSYIQRLMTPGDESEGIERALTQNHRRT
jgi:hypothetical protein